MKLKPPPKSRDWIQRTPQISATAFTGHSRFVRVAKFALPFLALVIIGIVIARLSQSPHQQLLAELPKEETTTPGQTEVMTAQYEGLTPEGRPYTLLAKKATRDPNNPDLVLLENPRGDITLEDKSWVAVESLAGSYNLQQARLNLNGNVAVFHDKGYELHLDNITVDLQTKTARADSPVMAQGPLGQLFSQNMEILDGGNRILFGGPARLILNNPRAGGKEKG